MRWRFPEYQTKQERAHRNELLQRIDAWWAAFKRHANQIAAEFKKDADKRIDLPKFMRQHLQAIDAQIYWEFGPAVHCDGHRLVITPESTRGLRPLIQSLLDRAPDLPGWEFYPYRLAESLDTAEAMINAQTKDTLQGMLVRVAGDEYNLIGLTYLHPGFDSKSTREASDTALVATESLLGEEILDNWIGYIETEPLKPRGLLRRGTDTTGLITPEKLKPTIDAMIDARISQLPPKPLYAMGVHEDKLPKDTGTLEWGSLKIEPTPRDDYPDRSDLFVAITAWIDCWKATYTNRPFCSRRFSRHGEVFCYLKADGRESFDGESWADRNELETDLRVALTDVQAGAVWGGGTGLVYSYVDFALTDVPRGVEAILNVLRRGNIHRRTWILFHEADLVDEWIGVYENTPPPPKHED